MELPITITSENAIKSAPHIGFKNPIAAIWKLNLLQKKNNYFILFFTRAIKKNKENIKADILPI